MPRRSSLKTLIIDSMLFVSLIALVAHLSINFWERYVIQTELSHMKYNLHSMKETIINIGNAYDILQTDLKGLIKTAENSISIKTSTKKEHEFEDLCTLDRRKLHNIKVQAMVKAKNERVGMSQAKMKELYNKNTNVNASNATTITKYPLKSMAIGSNSNLREECYDNDSCDRKTHRCSEVYKYCTDPSAVFEYRF